MSKSKLLKKNCFFTKSSVSVDSLHTTRRWSQIFFFFLTLTDMQHKQSSRKHSWCHLSSGSFWLSLPDSRCSQTCDSTQVHNRPAAFPTCAAFIGALASGPTAVRIYNTVVSRVHNKAGTRVGRSGSTVPLLETQALPSKSRRQVRLLSNVALRRSKSSQRYQTYRPGMVLFFFQL